MPVWDYRVIGTVIERDAWNLLIYTVKTFRKHPICWQIGPGVRNKWRSYQEKTVHILLELLFCKVPCQEYGTKRMADQYKLIVHDLKTTVKP